MCTIGEKDYDFRKPVLHTPSAHTDAFLGLSSKGSLGREDLSLGLERPRQLSTPNYRGALAPLTFDRRNGRSPLHLVSAFAVEHGLVLAQRAAEIATGLPWRQLAGLLERLKAVRYTSEGQTILQATTIQPELVEIFKKLGISAPKTILAVG
jgi:hypothetical protein